MKKYNVIKVWYIEPGRRKVEYLASSVNYTEALNILTDERILQSCDYTNEIIKDPFYYEFSMFTRISNGVTFTYKIEESMFDAIAELTKVKVKFPPISVN